MHLGEEELDVEQIDRNGATEVSRILPPDPELDLSTISETDNLEH
jgi:hypothetical protein